MGYIEGNPSYTDGIEPPPMHDDKQVRAYQLDCVERIKDGQPVWMQRNFEADYGRVFDYYQDRKHHGYVDQEDGICDAYLLPVEGSSQHGPVILGVDLGTAAQALVDAVTARQ